MPFIPEKLGVSSNEIVIQTMERLTSSKNACHFVQGICCIFVEKKAAFKFLGEKLHIIHPITPLYSFFISKRSTSALQDEARVRGFSRLVWLGSSLPIENHGAVSPPTSRVFFSLLPAGFTCFLFLLNKICLPLLLSQHKSETVHAGQKNKSDSLDHIYSVQCVQT